MGLSEHLAALGDNIKPGDSFGEAVTAKRLNGIMNAIRALAAGENINSGPGMELKRNPSGVTLKSTAKGGVGGEGGYVPPFACFFLGGNLTAEGVYYVPYLSVTPGFVNKLMPTSNGHPLDAVDVDPLLLWVYLSTSGSNYIYLKTVGNFDLTTGIETIDLTTVERSATELTDIALLNTWTAYDLISLVTLVSDGSGGFKPSAKVPSYRNTNLQVANFGSVNSYYS